MKVTVIKSLLASLAFLFSVQVSFASGLEWTKDTEVAVVRKGDDKPVILGEGAVSFVLGNGAVGFFPEASAEELDACGEVGMCLTVYDRFRVIATLVNHLDLNKVHYIASQNVPTKELAILASAVVSGESDIGFAKSELVKLANEYAQYTQYRLAKDE